MFIFPLENFVRKNMWINETIWVIFFIPISSPRGFFFFFIPFFFLTQDPRYQKLDNPHSHGPPSWPQIEILSRPTALHSSPFHSTLLSFPPQNLEISLFHSSTPHQFHPSLCLSLSLYGIYHAKFILLLIFYHFSWKINQRNEEIQISRVFFCRENSKKKSIFIMQSELN